MQYLPWLQAHSKICMYTHHQLKLIDLMIFFYVVIDDDLIMFDLT